MKYFKMNFILVFSFLLCSEFLIFVVCLKANDTGVCVVPRSVRKTRLKSYRVRINKWCGSKRCIVTRTKTEVYKQMSNNTVCCSGWQYESQGDRCAPYCSTGCIGGRCTMPEVCECDPPMIHHPENKNTCIMPTCEPPCVNGVCIASNTCSCNQGYEEVNNTCQPKCESCLNGKCNSPNVCDCNDGYSKSEGICKPVCDGCNNGVCTAPNICQCNEGYTRNDTSMNCYKPCPIGCISCDVHGFCLDGVCGCRFCKKWIFKTAS